MDESLPNLLNNAKSLTVLLPVSPVFDHIAAGLSLYLSIKETKDVTISSLAPITVDFNRLVGVDRIKQGLGNKNLVIKLKDYDAGGVERVSADIINGRFQLTVIPKPSISAPKKEQLEMTYSGINTDVVFLVGGESENHFPPLMSNELSGAKLLHLGTKPLSTEKPVLSFVRPASSVSEVVASVIMFSDMPPQQPLQGQASIQPQGVNKKPNFMLSQDVATNLLMGIEVGSGKFSSPTVTAETFQIVSELMRVGAKRNIQPTVSDKQFPPGSIPGVNPDQLKKQVKPGKVAGKDVVITGSDLDKEEQKKVPHDWLKTPRVYKGTSVS